MLIETMNPAEITVVRRMCEVENIPYTVANGPNGIVYDVICKPQDWRYIVNQWSAVMDSLKRNLR